MIKAGPKQCLPVILLSLNPPCLLENDISLTSTLLYADCQTPVTRTEKKREGKKGLPPPLVSFVGNPKIQKSDGTAKVQVRIRELSSWHLDDIHGSKFVVKIATTNPYIAPIFTEATYVQKSKKKGNNEDEEEEEEEDMGDLPGEQQGRRRAKKRRVPDAPDHFEVDGSLGQSPLILHEDAELIREISRKSHSVVHTAGVNCSDAHLILELLQTFVHLAPFRS
jgi:hypothetical protein